MAANYVENMIFEDKTIAKTALVANRGDKHVLAFRYFVRYNSAYIIDILLFHEADHEHLIHADISVLLINILKALGLQVKFKLLDSHRDLALHALLRGKENQIVLLGIRHKLFKLVLEYGLLGASHVPSDGQYAKILIGIRCCNKWRFGFFFSICLLISLVC